MAMTAAIINLNDARRTRTEQLDVRLSHLVTDGDEKKGLITIATNPKTIERIRSLLANADFAMQGVRREELGDMARTNSLWMQIGPYRVFYNLCLKRNQAEIESVDARSNLHPIPQPRKHLNLAREKSFAGAYIGKIDPYHAGLIRGNGIAAVIVIACIASAVFMLVRNDRRVAVHLHANSLSKNNIGNTSSLLSDVAPAMISTRKGNTYPAPDVNEMMEKLSMPLSDSASSFPTASISQVNYTVGETWHNSPMTYSIGGLFGSATSFGETYLRDIKNNPLQPRTLATTAPLFSPQEDTVSSYSLLGNETKSIWRGSFYSEGLFGTKIQNSLSTTFWPRGGSKTLIANFTIKAPSERQMYDAYNAYLDLRVRNTLEFVDEAFGSLAVENVRQARSDKFKILQLKKHVCSNSSLDYVCSFTVDVKLSNGTIKRRLLGRFVPFDKGYKFDDDFRDQSLRNTFNRSYSENTRISYSGVR
jgi:hypothetical protein